MNKTYNRILDLVVNERLEEGKRLEAVRAGVTRVGGAIKKHGVNAALTAAMVATAGYGMRNSAIRAADDDKPAATAAAAEPSNTISQVKKGLKNYDIITKQSKTRGTKGQVEGQEKPHSKDRVVKNESVMNNTYNRILNLVTETGIPGFEGTDDALKNATNIRPRKTATKKKPMSFVARSAALDALIKKNSPPGTPGR